MANLKKLAYDGNEVLVECANRDGDGNNIVDTYLTQSNASSTYLTQATASSTYLTQTSAANTYLTQSDAASTYRTIGTPIYQYTVIPNTSLSTQYIGITDNNWVVSMTLFSLTYSLLISGNTTVSTLQSFLTSGIFLPSYCMISAQGDASTTWAAPIMVGPTSSHGTAQVYVFVDGAWLPMTWQSSVKTTTRSVFNQ